MQSPFFRVPDINLKDLTLNTDRFLTTISDKQHCTLAQVKANECQVVEPEVIDKQGKWAKENGKGGKKYWDGKFKRIELNEGFVALVQLGNGDVAGFFEHRIKHVLEDDKVEFEIGVRVYKIAPGDCTKLCPPKIKDFWGFYRTELDNDNVPSVAAVAAIPGNERLVVVLERNAFPLNGNEFPLQAMPVDKLCIVDLGLRNPVGVFFRKKCILNLHHISDPYDVDLNGIFVYGLNQVKNEGLIVLDDYCIMIGTDTGKLVVVPCQQKPCQQKSRMLVIYAHPNAFQMFT